jgi:hypothetical protein
MSAPSSPIPAEPEEDNEIGSERMKRKSLKEIARKGSTNYPCLLMYNSIRENGSATKGIQAFSSIHASLMGLHGFMAGFQYVVLERTVTEIGSELSVLRKAEFTLRVLGFSCSLAGTMISLITMEYLKSIEWEGLELQVEGCLKYANFFRHSDELGFLASLVLAITTNMLLYDYLPLWLCITLNATSSIMSLYILYYFHEIILGRQKYGGGRHLYKDEDFKRASMRN